MMTVEYWTSLLTWALMIGCAVGVAWLLVDRSLRRRVVYSTLLFTIPLAMLGFVDGVSNRLGLVECSGGIAAMAISAVVLLGPQRCCRP